MNTIMCRAASIVVWAMIAALSITGDALAAIVGCRPVSGAFSVFLSEPSENINVFPNNQARRSFLERLQFELDQSRNAQWVRSPTTDVRFKACFERMPELGGTEFDSSTVESLYHDRVLLEIWGRLDIVDVGGGTTKPSAQLNYLLVPVKYADNKNEPVPEALQRLQYPEEGAVATADFVQLIARPLDIDAFVAAAFGYKLLRESDFDLAHQNLCRATVLLERIEQRGLTGRTRDDVAALRAFVLEWARRAITASVSDPDYDPTGVLRLQDPNAPCAGED